MSSTTPRPFGSFKTDTVGTRTAKHLASGRARREADRDREPALQGQKRHARRDRDDRRADEQGHRHGA